MFDSHLVCLYSLQTCLSCHILLVQSHACILQADLTSIAKTSLIVPGWGSLCAYTDRCSPFCQLTPLDYAVSRAYVGRGRSLDRGLGRSLDLGLGRQA